MSKEPKIKSEKTRRRNYRNIPSKTKLEKTSIE